ncbi:hypothetical protein SLEP1_g44740 [Rubroshorea leprosula]|uniref:Uncharacterized protein n=1 Tax=Rubroshorea leprosula TaxID=152421 RepID=A0AAV5LHI5_9ROSI|nr:hypothetical protein SLEP1_g44740 [Rubroshorea leprosula]
MWVHVDSQRNHDGAAFDEVLVGLGLVEAVDDGTNDIARGVPVSYLVPLRNPDLGNPRPRQVLERSREEMANREKKGGGRREKDERGARMCSVLPYALAQLSFSGSSSSAFSPSFILRNDGHFHHTKPPSGTHICSSFLCTLQSILWLLHPKICSCKELRSAPKLGSSLRPTCKAPRLALGVDTPMPKSAIIRATRYEVMSQTVRCLRSEVTDLELPSLHYTRDKKWGLCATFACVASECLPRGPTSGLCRLAEVKIRAWEHFGVLCNYKIENSQVVDLVLLDLPCGMDSLWINYITIW